MAVLQVCMCVPCLCVCPGCVRVSGVRLRAHVFVWGKGESVQEEKKILRLNRDLKF